MRCIKPVQIYALFHKDALVPCDTAGEVLRAIRNDRLIGAKLQAFERNQVRHCLSQMCPVLLDLPDSCCSLTLHRGQHCLTQIFSAARLHAISLWGSMHQIQYINTWMFAEYLCTKSRQYSSLKVHLDTQRMKAWRDTAAS